VTGGAGKSGTGSKNSCRFFLGIRGREAGWAGNRDAGLLSLVSSAHRNDIAAIVHVKDVLDRMLAAEIDDESLRPDVWKHSHPEVIRISERRSGSPRNTPRLRSGPVAALLRATHRLVEPAVNKARLPALP
jgi:hypothetical protein